MTELAEEKIFIDAAEFSAIVKTGLSFGMPDKVWWLNRRTMRYTANDMADPYSMLPVMAYIAEDRWRILGPVTGTLFQARYFPDENMQFGHGLVAIIATNRTVAGAAFMAAITLNDLPAGNLDPVVESFVRYQDILQSKAAA